jgi:protein phosphatase 1L
MLALNGSSITCNWLIVVDVFWQASFWKDPTSAIKEAYHNTDVIILNNAPNLGPGGSTAVTAILIDGKELLVANVGDSRAVLSRGGVAEQLSIDHEPGQPTERDKIENRGGFVSNMPGNVLQLS